jgi:ABC-type uncharacterized transport system substrate-binding protein
MHLPPVILTRRTRRYRFARVLMLAAMCFATSASHADEVAVVLSDDGGAYRDVYGQLTATLREHDADIRVRPLTLNAAADNSRFATQERSPDLAITVGVRATRAVVANNPALPVLSVLIPRMAYEAINREAHPSRRDGTLSAVFLDQPAERSFALARLALPKATRLGSLLGPKYSALASELDAAATQAGLRWSGTQVGREQETVPAIRKMLDGNDAILAVYDPDVLTPTTAKWLLYMAYQHRAPVLGFSAAYVRAGALAAVYSRPDQIGRQAGEAVMRWFDGGRGALPPPADPKYFAVEVNQGVAHSLGLALPDVDQLTRLITRQAEGRE